MIGNYTLDAPQLTQANNMPIHAYSVKIQYVICLRNIA